MLGSNTEIAQFSNKIIRTRFELIENIMHRNSLFSVQAFQYTFWQNLEWQNLKYSTVLQFSHFNLFTYCIQTKWKITTRVLGLIK